MPSRTNSDSTTASRDRVLIWELGTKRQSRGHKDDLPFDLSADHGNAKRREPPRAETTARARTRPSEQAASFVRIDIGQRWVDVEAPGNSDTKEISTRIASVRVPLTVMIQRCFGRYKEMAVVRSM